MQHTQASLLRTERFLPLFVTQALGAFNDNGLRYGITILIVYDLAARLGINGGMFVALGAALFIAPYFLFSAIAGQLADKYDKALLARRDQGPRNSHHGRRVGQSLSRTNLAASHCPVHRRDAGRLLQPGEIWTAATALETG